MIKLTPFDGEPMYLKIDAIIAFWWLGDRTEIRMIGDFGFDVKETPEQIRILMYGRDSSGAIMDA